MTSISRWGGSRWHGRALAGALALCLAACGGNLTSGGFGETAVAVSGDAPDPAAVPVPSSAALGAPARDSGSGDKPDGEIEVEFLLYLDSDEVGSVSLTDDPLRVRVDLQGRQEADAANASVPAAHYDGLRIVFTDIKAEVKSGLVVDGVPVTGEVRVELKEGTLTVVRPLPLDIGDGDRVDLLIDLNTATWLQAVDPDLHTVAETVAAQAIEVRVR